MPLPKLLRGLFDGPEHLRVPVTRRTREAISEFASRTHMDLADAAAWLLSFAVHQWDVANYVPNKT